MSGLSLVLILVGWIWSIRAGVTVSLLCAILNLTFPPVSQMIFSIYEPQVRLLTLVLLAGLVLGVVTSVHKETQIYDPPASRSISA